MQEPQRQQLSCIVSLALVFLSGGCASSYMRVVQGEEAVSEPQPGKAMMVFMRPSMVGGAIQASVFEINDGKASFAGIVSAKTKVAYDAAPGEHLFMVVGESADFMSASVRAGKTYYALVTPRMGMWKARFSLKPVEQGELESGKFVDWLKSCKWAEKTPEADQWADNNMDSILNKHDTYIKKWNSKSDASKPRLLPNDGM